MRSGRETSEVAGFLVCLFGGLAFAFKVVIPALRDIEIEAMRYFMGIGFGFGIGVCFFLIYLPINDLVFAAYRKFAVWTEGGKKKSKSEQADREEDADEP